MSKMIMILILALGLMMPSLALAQTKMITEMTEDTSPTGDDLVYVVDAPGGTPADRKVTISNLMKGGLHLEYSSNVLSLVNSTSAQTLNIFTTYTDGSNYEGMSLWGATGAVYLQAITSGTGTDTVNIILSPGGQLGAVRVLRPLYLGVEGYGSGRMLFLEDTDNGDNYVMVMGPETLAADYTLILPDAAPGGANYLLNFDADGTGGFTNPSTFQANLSLIAGTYTNGYLCTYTTAGTLLDCNTNPATYATASNWGGSAAAPPALGTGTPAAGTFTTLTAGSANSLTIGTSSSAAGSIILKNATNANAFTLLSGVSGAAIGWTLPTAAPAGNDYLVKSSTAGVLGYTDPATFATAANWSGSAAIPPAIGSGTPAAGTFTTLTAGSASSLTIGTASTAAGSILFKNATNANAFTLLSGVSGAAISWTLPTAVAGGDDYLINVDADGTIDYTDPASFDPAGTGAAAAAASVPLATIVAEGDILRGTAAATVGVLTKGAANTFVGVNSGGTQTNITQHTHVLDMALTTANLTYSTTEEFVLTAGEALAFGEIVYCKNKAGVHACYKYDRNGADKALPPRFIVVSATIDADATGNFMARGSIRKDAWAMTTNQDEGKDVYASATPGAIDLTISATGGDMVIILGEVLEENRIFFNPSKVLVEVP